jgi:sirohydrochlorin ferrochelatase
MSETGYIVFAHGSSIESANEAVRAVAAEMALRGALRIVEAAFLESGQPSLPGALKLMADRVSHVVVVPYFLTLGLHLQRDLPRLIEEVKQAHPDVRIDVAAPLDQHPAMVDALLDRARESACRPA